MQYVGAVIKMSRPINMAEPFFEDGDKERIHRELEDILSSRLSMGDQVKSLECEFAKCVGRKYAVAMNSCTSALEASLRAVGVANKEVILPSQTFIATAAAVVNSGGKPVFAEINEEDMCLDPNDVLSLITKDTAAIITVHIFGRVSGSINVLREICKKRNIYLIEDAAHGPGGAYGGETCGQFGDMACFSFYSTKILGAGEGGVLVTDSEILAKSARSYALRGLLLDNTEELYSYAGRNVRLTEINALLMRVQLERLKERLERRRSIASIYGSMLSGVDGLEVLCPLSLEESSFWKFPVLLKEGIDRQKVLARMHQDEIYIDTAYNPPAHKHPAFKDSGRSPLVRTEALLARHLCLPSHDRMLPEDAKRVVESLLSAIEEAVL